MKCPEPHILEEYLDGDLVETHRREVEDHLAVCSACRTLVESERALAAGLRESLPLAAPPGFHDRVTAALAPARAPSLLPDWLWALGLGLVVALAGLALGRFGASIWPEFSRSLEAFLPDLGRLVRDLNQVLPGGDWLTQLPGGYFFVLNFLAAGVVLAWGLWQMVKALRR
ncbi:MAG: hypothetical protein C4524_04625 [Candidatus Zixiibacteriota bacterium]|nr:MAG: hypothetical protein C4524_04625 [candidate division Zixibacteria bacterium]